MTMSPWPWREFKIGISWQLWLLWCFMKCILGICSFQCSLCSNAAAVCSVLYTVCSVQCLYAMCSVWYAMCSLLYTVCSVLFLVCSVQCFIYSMQYAVCSVYMQCAGRPVATLGISGSIAETLHCYTGTLHCSPSQYKAWGPQIICTVRYQMSLFQILSFSRLL